MADLLSHVLAAYVLLTVASWRVNWITQRWIPVGMGGAAIPDLVKIDLVLDDVTVETFLGAPFSWAPISSIGGVLLIAGVITLLFDRDYWSRTFGFLVGGGITSLVLDGMRVYADGRAGPWLYPFTWWRPPTPSLYVTSDPRVVVVVLLVAGVVFAIDRRIFDREDGAVESESA